MCIKLNGFGVCISFNQKFREGLFWEIFNGICNVKPQMHIDLLVTNMTLEYKVWLLHFSYYYVRLPASKEIMSPTPERKPRTRALRGLRLSCEMCKATRTPSELWPCKTVVCCGDLGLLWRDSSSMILWNSSLPLKMKGVLHSGPSRACDLHIPAEVFAHTCKGYPCSMMQSAKSTCKYTQEPFKVQRLTGMRWAEVGWKEEVAV